MPDIVGEAVDKLITIEAKNRGMPHGILQPMYEAARKAAGGRPVTMVAAEGLKKALTEVATVPMIFAASGNCHVFVDADADLAMARDIIINAKTQRPGVCNAAETLLVHEDVAARFLPEALAACGGEPG